LLPECDAAKRLDQVRAQQPRRGFATPVAWAILGLNAKLEYASHSARAFSRVLTELIEPIQLKAEQESEQGYLSAGLPVILRGSSSAAQH
jgi:hypothetical protein